MLFYPETFDEPAAAGGDYTMNLTGGFGEGGNGGNGGDFYANLDYGSLGGHLKVYSTGTVDASFTAPPPAAHLGAMPLDVTADLEISYFALGDPTVPALDEVFLREGDTTVYRRSATGDEVITGISTNAGVTLTLPLDMNGGTQARIDLENDVRNAGTITVVKLGDGISAGDLRLRVGNFVGAAGSSIDLAGDDVPLLPAGDGGDLALYADHDWSAYQSLGSVFNAGTIDTSGGDGQTGGRAGSVDFDANLQVINTGSIDASGGGAVLGDGGDGGDFEIDTDYGRIWNSGAIMTDGGDGHDNGGDAGSIYMYLGYQGEVRNTGSLSAAGGPSHADCPTGCVGGDGNYVEFYVDGGEIYNNASVDTSGGDSPRGSGGDGDSFNLYTYDEYGWYNGDVPGGSIYTTGAIDLSGSDGLDGGNAGDIDLEIDADGVPDNQEGIFYGYGVVDLTGGAGTLTGGSGGDFSMENEYSYNGDVDGPSGGCVNYAELRLVGGEGLIGVGGPGGDLTMETEDSCLPAEGGAWVVNHGDVDTSGGFGATDGGSAGEIWMYGFHGVENHAALTAMGGDTTGAGGAGGSADSISIFSDLGPVDVMGDVRADGGVGSADDGHGGDGDEIDITGVVTTVTGLLSACGGDGGAVSGTGGDGSLINVYGTIGGALHAGGLNVSPGAGDTDGEPGSALVDGFDMTGSALP